MRKFPFLQRLTNRLRTPHVLIWVQFGLTAAAVAYLALAHFLGGNFFLFSITLTASIIILGSGGVATIGRKTLAVSMALGSIFLSSLFHILRVEQVGIYYLIILGTFTFTLVSTLVPQRFHRAILTIGGGSALFLWLTDLTGSLERESITILQRNLLGTLALAMLVGAIIYLLTQFKNYKLRTKFILSVTALAVISLAASFFFVTQTVRSFLIEQVGQDLQNVADSKGNIVGELLASDVQLLQTAQRGSLISLVRNVNLQYTEMSEAGIDAAVEAKAQLWAESSEAERQQLMDAPSKVEVEAFRETVPTFTDLILTDKYGGLIASNWTPDQYDFRDEIWWKAAVDGGNGEIYISPPTAEFADSPNEFEIVLAIPLVSQEEIVGVLRAVVPANDMVNGLRLNDALGATGGAGLVIGTREFTFLDDEVGYVDINLSHEQIARLKSGQTIEANFRGETNFLSYAPIQTLSEAPSINELGWFVLAHQTEVEALQAVASQQRTQILVGILIILVGGLAAVAVGQIVAAPILHLTRVSQRVAAGDLSARADIDAGDEIANLALTFNNMAEQIQATQNQLERRVAERTRALTVSERVSRSLSTIINKEELITAVVKQTQEAFNYYHVHIYLLSPDQTKLIMVAGSGEAGKKLMKAKHFMPIGLGLVGQAARERRAVLVQNVADSANWQPNKLLPDTKTELAVPIILGDRVVGVLDVQDTEIGVLTQRDVDLVQSIANQVAIGLRNAELYEQAQNEAAREALINEITQKIQNTNDIDEAMKTAVRELGRALNAPKTAVRLHASERNGHG